MQPISRSISPYVQRSVKTASATFKVRGRVAVICALCALLVTTAEAAPPRPARVYSGKQVILTGPYNATIPAQERASEFRPVSHDAVFLENEYLRCCLLPQLGGRIYDVYNKTTKSSLFHLAKYLELHTDETSSSHEWNLGGIEVNFPFSDNGNTFKDVWSWASIERPAGVVGVAMSFTAPAIDQRAVFRVLLAPESARLDLEYRFENLSPFPWSLDAQVIAAHDRTKSAEWTLPSDWCVRRSDDEERIVAVRPASGDDLSALRHLTPDVGLDLTCLNPSRSFLCLYDRRAKMGAVRVFDRHSFPGVRLHVDGPPVAATDPRLHFTTTGSPIGPWGIHSLQPELSAIEANDSWFQIRGMENCVFANRRLALSVARGRRNIVRIAIAAAERLRDCAVFVVSAQENLYHVRLDLDPKTTWRRDVDASADDIVVRVVAADGAEMAHYTLLAIPQPTHTFAQNLPPRRVRSAAAEEEFRAGQSLAANNAFDRAVAAYRRELKGPFQVASGMGFVRSCLKSTGFASIGSTGASADHALIAEAGSVVAKLSKKRHAGRTLARFYDGLIHEKRGEFAEAAGLYRSAAKSGVPALVSSVYLSRLLLKKNKREAVRVASEATRYYPQSVRARQLLMVAYTLADRAGEAIKLGERLLTIDPADPTTMQLLADAYEASNKTAEAQRVQLEVERLLADNEPLRDYFTAAMTWLRAGEVDYRQKRRRR